MVGKVTAPVVDSTPWNAPFLSLANFLCPGVEDFGIKDEYFDTERQLSRH